MGTLRIEDFARHLGGGLKQKGLTMEKQTHASIEARVAALEIFNAELVAQLTSEQMNVMRLRGRLEAASSGLGNSRSTQAALAKLATKLPG